MGRDGLSRLADLIDPDCEDGRYEGVRTARPVDRGALLELADEMEEEGVGAFSTIVRGGWLVDSACRIREACGEVHDG